VVTRTDAGPRSKLEAALHLRGKNPSWLARKAGFGYMHTWTVVSGRTFGSRRFYEACAKALGVEVSDLIDEEVA
jgi:hypothetical protein